jgi:hypothetical protein
VKRILLVAVVLVLAVPASAFARRALTGSAKDPLVGAALGRQVPRQCAAVYISSLSRFWGSVSFAPTKGWASRCQPFGSNGLVVLHHTRGRWRIATAGSSIMCPVPRTPVRIALDLRIPCNQPVS